MFEIKLYDFPATWVEQKLDALCIRHMRVWLEMPVSACVSEIASLPKRMGGMGISSIKSLVQKNVSKQASLFSRPRLRRRTRDLS